MHEWSCLFVFCLTGRVGISVDISVSEPLRCNNITTINPSWTAGKVWGVGECGGERETIERPSSSDRSRERPTKRGGKIKDTRVVCV